MLLARQARCGLQILAELRAHGEKRTCWIWWIYPTDREGALEPHPRTAVSAGTTAPWLLVRAPPAWRAVLEEIGTAIAARGMRLGDVLPATDHGRLQAFVPFWRGVLEEHPCDWLSQHLDMLDEALRRMRASASEARWGDEDVHEEEGRPPSPWASSKAKQRIVHELKDEQSDIHLLIGSYTSSNFEQVNFPQILQKYADSKYKIANFRQNVKRILVHLQNKTGPFNGKISGEGNDDAEKWYTSAQNTSKAYVLLFLLYMNKSNSQTVSSMSAEEIWQSHPLFQKYELEQFKKYNTKMKGLTSKRRRLLDEEEDAYQKEMLSCPKKEATSRGYPFWNCHPAADLLKEDEIVGAAKRMKPIKIWESRPEYQDFPLYIFRKHIYQERSKQLASPFWQHRRNKMAMKQVEEAQELMKDWHQTQSSQGVDGIVQEWGRLNLRGD